MNQSNDAVRRELDVLSDALVERLWVRSASFLTLERARAAFGRIHADAQVMEHRDVGMVTMVEDGVPFVMVQAYSTPPPQFARRIELHLASGRKYTPSRETVVAYAVRRWSQIIDRQTSPVPGRPGMVEYRARLNEPRVMNNDGSDSPASAADLRRVVAQMDLSNPENRQ